ncbi:tripartite tricarboxylate transporter substrate binding protein [Belnapia sp. T6]|uniref:Tripartite tricarboxylate transporter substrate binding protein n=1 Tax=Belnapia mucosa TaxID=2804532 RepID=A0ABS1VCE5_9PROT|nr:tripartite tricarboxylate transporter substrate binding protein [Belnapia mucosa]MBL6459346.1 tripartite tricarboxylate transporter substrate binding protein [Belnapia mucosa]
MPLTRRATLALPLASLPVALPSQTKAADWPGRPVRIVVPFTPGGPVDIIARVLAPKLESAWGQPIVIENRPGGGGNVGSVAVARAAPDGHTLLLCASSHAINPGLYRNMPFDTTKDFAPCALLTSGAFILVVHPSLPVRTVRDLIAYARAHPGVINYASAGSGSGNHLAGELFKQMAGVDMVHIPFPGAAPANTAVLSGQAKVMFNNMISAAQHMPDGSMIGLAVTTPSRIKALPDLPAIAEVLPGFEVSAWYGLLAPAGTPTPIVDQIYRTATSAVADPAVGGRITGLGLEPAPMGPEQFSRFITVEMEKWARVIEVAKAQVD